MADEREQMNIVVIGHVDHGKSTVIGRLLADTKSLPEGKLEEVKARCKANARPFEYAFLLDALADEQAQGITIDSARCFFKSDKREYIIIDAPGHIEFLKNMISGAARAEAALLVIDAKEGVQENSRRHGYLLSMLGIKQAAVCVNKMDLVDYDKETFDNIVTEYTEFLSRVGIVPRGFIPASARDGDNIASISEKTPWYTGKSVLDMFDDFEKEASRQDKPFRFPVQDIYKFTEEDDDRRIAAGRVETGSINVGDEVVFLPSKKRSKISSIESFNTPTQKTAFAGQSAGFTFNEQIYIKPGEIMVKVDDDKIMIGKHIKVNIFWMGNQPMIMGKRYKLKLGTVRIPVWLKSVENVLDASELTTDSSRKQIERHDVAECILELLNPIAFDLTSIVAETGRFVIIDNYEIAGGGVVLDKVDNVRSRVEDQVRQRELSWDKSAITQAKRQKQYDQRATLVLIRGPVGVGKKLLGKELEAELFRNGRYAYYLGLSDSLGAIGDQSGNIGERDEYIRRLGEVGHLFTEAGLVLITTVSDLDDYELAAIETLNKPNDCVVVNVAEDRFADREVDIEFGAEFEIHEAVKEIKELLEKKNVTIEYYL